MMRALLAGSKTQTRRAVTRLAGFGPVTDFQRSDTPGYAWTSRDRGARWNDIDHRRLVQCSPYGAGGDQLWVREAIRLVPDQEPDDGTGRVLSVYGADGAPIVADAWPWKRSYLSPMHCPRGLSRMSLEVTGVRIESLQDISPADARAEGYPEQPPAISNPPIVSRAQWYFELWEQINGRGSRAANTWVWVVEFRRIRP
jgi:hypothetical protein